MKYDFDSIVERRGTNSFKWDFCNKIFKSEELLPMWVADMDFLAPKEVKGAITKRVEHGVFGYTIKGESYYRSIINWVKKRHGFDIKKEWILSLPGVVPTLSIAILSYTKPGDKVLIQTPVYHPFFTAIEGNERVKVENPLIKGKDGYEIDFKDLEEKLKDVRMMILCNPHNPVGRVFRKEELIKIGELCKKNNVIIASDEIHSDIIYKGYKHIPIASISKELEDITVTCIAASKTFNVAGLCASCAIIPNDCLRERFFKTAEALGIVSSNLLGNVALEASYKYGEEWLNELLEYLEENRDYLLDFVAKRIPRIKAIKSEGTYLVWLDCRGLNMDSEELRRFMIHDAKVGLNEGVSFGTGGEGFMRLNIGCPRKLLNEGLERIERAVKNI